jgi:hypothetical protein
VADHPAQRACLWREGSWGRHSRKVPNVTDMPDRGRTAFGSRSCRSHPMPGGGRGSSFLPLRAGLPSSCGSVQSCVSGLIVR